jgi:hypothetical protein
MATADKTRFRRIVPDAVLEILGARRRVRRSHWSTGGRGL